MRAHKAKQREMRAKPKYTTQLPDHFVDSLKVLFDILDTDRKGFVTYDEICARWRHLPTAQLPSNFLDCLGRLTPPSGKLTFERFLAGIRLALTEKRQGTTNLHRVRSEGKLDMDDQGMDRTRFAGPTMGLNGFDRRSAFFASQPEVYSSNAAAADNYQVIMRTKKNLPPAYNNLMDNRDSRLIRIPQPPPQPEKDPQMVKIPLQPQNGNRFRPVSSNSFGSVSSGMAEIQWRNSQMSTSPSTISGESQSSNGRHAYSDDQSPKVARHERLLEEELELMQRGVDVTNRLLSWYSERLTSIAKRKEMLHKGIVALDTSVHEQKLNFVRASITELNRRMAALCESSERGFPTHGNLIKNQMPQPSDDPSQWLHKQNKRLTDELEEKTRLIEQMQKEKRLSELRQMPPAVVGRTQNHRHSALLERPSAYVKPALHQQPQIYLRPIATTPVKVHDTLL